MGFAIVDMHWNAGLCFAFAEPFAEAAAIALLPSSLGEKVCTLHCGWLALKFACCYGLPRCGDIKQGSTHGCSGFFLTLW